ncbi:hypothetical protein [Tenacibaculum maritimum]|uniref:hypothetical protein n=1 Tax=Tenacibaculum maritimum TaxID=107401 RepID=UPI00388FBEFF
MATHWKHLLHEEAIEKKLIHTQNDARIIFNEKNEKAQLKEFAASAVASSTNLKSLLEEQRKLEEEMNALTGKTEEHSNSNKKYNQTITTIYEKKKKAKEEVKKAKRIRRKQEITKSERWLKKEKERFDLQARIDSSRRRAAKKEKVGLGTSLEDIANKKEERKVSIKKGYNTKEKKGKQVVGKKDSTFVVKNKTDTFFKKGGNKADEVHRLGKKRLNIEVVDKELERRDKVFKLATNKSREFKRSPPLKTITKNKETFNEKIKESEFEKKEKKRFSMSNRFRKTNDFLKVSNSYLNKTNQVAKHFNGFLKKTDHLFQKENRQEKLFSMNSLPRVFTGEEERNKEFNFNKGVNEALLLSKKAKLDELPKKRRTKQKKDRL